MAECARHRRPSATLGYRLPPPRGITNIVHRARWQDRRVDVLNYILSILQALATPTLAGAGIAIAWQQKRLADIRLRNDLFDRRFKIYEAARTYLQCAVQDQRFDPEHMFAFIRGTADAPFFCSHEIADYIEEIRQKVADMRARAGLMEAKRDAVAGSVIDQTYDLQQWCAQQHSRTEDPVEIQARDGAYPFADIQIAAGAGPNLNAFISTACASCSRRLRVRQRQDFQ